MQAFCLRMYYYMYAAFDATMRLRRAHRYDTMYARGIKVTIKGGANDGRKTA